MIKQLSILFCCSGFFLNTLIAERDPLRAAKKAIETNDLPSLKIALKKIEDTAEDSSEMKKILTELLSDAQEVVQNPSALSGGSLWNAKTIGGSVLVGYAAYGLVNSVIISRKFDTPDKLVKKLKDAGFTKDMFLLLSVVGAALYSGIGGWLIWRGRQELESPLEKAKTIESYLENALSALQENEDEE